MSDSPAIVWIEKDELDRLRAENGDHLAWIEHLKAENERLRAILASTAQEDPCQPQD